MHWYLPPSALWKVVWDKRSFEVKYSWKETFVQDYYESWMMLNILDRDTKCWIYISKTGIKADIQTLAIAMDAGGREETEGSLFLAESRTRRTRL